MKLLGRGGDWWSVKWGHPVCDQLREALGVEVRDVARARVISVDSVTARLSEDGTEAVKGGQPLPGGSRPSSTGSM